MTVGLVPPFQGLNSSIALNPGRCPGLICEALSGQIHGGPRCCEEVCNTMAACNPYMPCLPRAALAALACPGLSCLAPSGRNAIATGYRNWRLSCLALGA